MLRSGPQVGARPLVFAATTPWGAAHAVPYGMSEEPAGGEDGPVQEGGAAPEQDLRVGGLLRCTLRPALGSMLRSALRMLCSILRCTPCSCCTACAGQCAARSWQAMCTQGPGACCSGLPVPIPTPNVLKHTNTMPLQYYAPQAFATPLLTSWYQPEVRLDSQDSQCSRREGGETAQRRGHQAAGCLGGAFLWQGPQCKAGAASPWPCSAA